MEKTFQTQITLKPEITITVTGVPPEIEREILAKCMAAVAGESAIVVRRRRESKEEAGEVQVQAHTRGHPQHSEQDPEEEETEEESEPSQASDQCAFDNALYDALMEAEGAAEIWQRFKERGASDRDIHDQLMRQLDTIELAPDEEGETVGTVRVPVFTWQDPEDEAAEPIQMEDGELVANVRALFGIPQPQPGSEVDDQVPQKPPAVEPSGDLSAINPNSDEQDFEPPPAEVVDPEESDEPEPPTAEAGPFSAQVGPGAIILLPKAEPLRLYRIASIDDEARQFKYVEVNKETGEIGNDVFTGSLDELDSGDWARWVPPASEASEINTETPSVAATEPMPQKAEAQDPFGPDNPLPDALERECKSAEADIIPVIERMLERAERHADEAKPVIRLRKAKAKGAVITDRTIKRLEMSRSGRDILGLVDTDDNLFRVEVVREKYELVNA